jgi:hypothetical protein
MAMLFHLNSSARDYLYNRDTERTITFPGAEKGDRDHNAYRSGLDMLL